MPKPLARWLLVCYRLRPMSRFNRGQRVIAIVAWGIALYFVGQYLTTLGTPFGSFGWVAYAPNSHVYFSSGLWLTPLECLFVWLGLAALWLVGSVLLLRTS